MALGARVWSSTIEGGFMEESGKREHNCFEMINWDVLWGTRKEIWKG